MIRLKYLLSGLIKYISLILAAIMSILPIIVVFFASFKTTEEYNNTSKLTLPQSFLNFKNYYRAFTEGNMLLGFFNTFFIVIMALFGAIILGTLVSYVLSRFDFKFKKVIVGLYLFATLIPSITTQVATFQIVEALNLFNTRWSAIILFMTTDIISVYIFLQFLNSISFSLDESAMLDGASYFTIYHKIILPLLKPAIATVIIVKGINIYNDFYTAYLYMPAKELQVISTSLFNFQGPYGNQWEVICAAIIIALIPSIVIFLALQKYIYNGFTQGAIK